MSRVVIAIDPGLHAGVCIMDKCGVFWSGPVEIGDAADLKLTRSQVESRSPTEVMTEAVAWKASSYKKCPKYNSGILVGALDLQNLPLTFIGPGTWRSALWGKGNWPTKEAKAKAMQWVKDTYGLQCVNDNEADAICLAHYAFYVKGDK